MPVEYQGFSFASPPRTGVVYFLEACRIADLGDGDLAEACKRFSKEDNGRLRVSLVRHPLDWLSSVYGAITNPGNEGAGKEGAKDTHHIFHSFIMFDKSDFNSFVRSYLKECPTGVSCLFDSYKAGSRLRWEDMPWALLELLETTGVKDKDVLKAVELYWRSNCWEVHPEWDADLAQQVFEAERELYCDLDYY